MSTHDVNDRKQKLNNIILKITEFQLLKLKAASNGGCNREIAANLNQILEQAAGIKNLKSLTGGPGSKPELVGLSAKLVGDMSEPAEPGANE